jgi:hypothetical protein
LEPEGEVRSKAIKTMGMVTLGLNYFYGHGDYPGLTTTVLICGKLVIQKLD